MQTTGRSMSTRAVVPFFSLLLTVSLGLANLCLTDCPQSRECDRGHRQVHASCGSLQSCARAECCLNGQSAVSGTATRKVVAPRLCPEATDGSTLFRVIRTSQRVAQTRSPPAEASTAQLFSLHCAFLI